MLGICNTALLEAIPLLSAALLFLPMGYKTKRAHGVAASHISKPKPTRRTRQAERADVLHLQESLQDAMTRIASLRVQVDQQRAKEKELKSALAAAEAELAGISDSLQGPVRKLRCVIYRLKCKLRTAEATVAAAGEPDDSGDEGNDGVEDEEVDEEEDEDEEEEEKELQPKRRPKLGSYRKTGGGATASSSIAKFNDRKWSTFASMVDFMFNYDVRNTSPSIPAPENHEDPYAFETMQRGAAAFRFSLHQLFNKRPELWHQLLRERKTAKQCEEAAAATIRRHWEKQGLNMFTRCCMTQDGWQILINLLSSQWSPELKDFLRVTFPGGTIMPLMISVDQVVKERNKIAEELGLETTDVSATFDALKALRKRLEYLDDIDLLSPSPDDPECLLVQFLADASTIFSAKNQNATAVVFKPVYNDSTLDAGSDDLVNSRKNLVLLNLYRKDDSYKNMCEHSASTRLQIDNLMKNGIVVNGRHWRVKVPLGGDLKLLSALLGIAGGKSDYPCIYCESSVHEFSMTKEDWAAKGLEMPFRSYERIIHMNHIPQARQYRCPVSSCKCIVAPGDEAPDITGWNPSKRQAKQRLHFGCVPGRLPYVNVEPFYYILDSLHLVLRLVPMIYRQTIAANCNKKAMERVAGWCLAELDLLISSDAALQTDTGVKHLSMSAESWPGSTCRQLLDHFPELLKIAIPEWEGSQAAIYSRCYAVWENFFYLASLISDGCDFASRNIHAQELDAAGATFLHSYVAVATNEACRSPYLHMVACHLGHVVRMWGSLVQWSSQGCESIHQWIKFFAKQRSNRRQWIKTTSINVAARQHIEMTAGPARREQGPGRKRKTVGHMSKGKEEVHKKIKQEVMLAKKKGE